MQVAQRTQHRLVGRGVVLDHDRRILGDHPVEHVGDPLLVAAFFRCDGDPVHRHRELERPHVDVVLVVRVVQHAVEIDLVDLGHRRDVAGNRAIRLDALAALEEEEMPHLERLAAVADEELRVPGYRSLVHAEDAELADERVDDDLEHVREDVLLRIRFRPELLRRVAFALEEQRRVAFRRIRRELHQNVEELGDPGAGLRRDEADRNEMPFTQCLLEGRMQLIRFDLALLEIERHQFLVDFDDLVDQRAVRIGDGGEIRLSVGIEKAVDDLRAAGRRKVDRQALAAERVPGSRPGPSAGRRSRRRSC